MNRMVIVSLVVARWRVGCWTIASLGTSLLPGRTKVGRIDKARHPRAEKLRSAVKQAVRRLGRGLGAPLKRPSSTAKDGISAEDCRTALPSPVAEPVRVDHADKKRSGA
jgi:hypothetical protein